MSRPRGSKVTPDTVVYHRTCYRLDLANSTDKAAYDMLKDHNTRPSGTDAARGVILFAALREVLSPITFQRLCSLAGDFFASDDENRTDHPFVAFASGIGQQASIAVPAYAVPVQTIPAEEEYKPRKAKRRSKATASQPASDDKPYTPVSTDEPKEISAHAEEPNMDDGFDSMDGDDISSLFKMSQSAFLE